MSAHVTSVLSLTHCCWTSLKKDSIPTFLFYVYGGLPRCLSVLHMHTVLTEARTSVRFPWNWSLGQLIATTGCWEWNPALPTPVLVIPFLCVWVDTSFYQDFLRRLISSPPHLLAPPLFLLWALDSGAVADVSMHSMAELPVSEMVTLGLPLMWWQRSFSRLLTQAEDP